MTINFEQTQQVVEKCWEIACKAKLPAAGEMITGPGMFNSIRLQLFQQLVSQLVPNNQILEGNTKAFVNVQDNKEKWQE